MLVITDTDCVVFIGKSGFVQASIRLAALKACYPGVGLSRICRLFDVTRQSYYQQLWRQDFLSIEEHLVLKEVKRIRQYHRRLGTRKLYEKLQFFLLENQIKMGRDALF